MKSNLLLLLAAIFLAAPGFAQQLQWSRQIGAAGNDEAISLAQDAAGNTYVLGTFSGTVSFGCTTLTSMAAANNMYVAKYSPAGTCQWVTQDTGSVVMGITADQAGNTYVAGQRPLLRKFSPAGAMVERMNADTVQFVGGPVRPIGQAVHVDAMGNLYIAGAQVYADPPFQLGSVQFGWNGATSIDGFMFVAMRDPQGTWQWGS